MVNCIIASAVWALCGKPNAADYVPRTVLWAESMASYSTAR